MTDLGANQGYTHRPATVEIAKEWFDWAYKQKNLFRPSMKLIRATQRDGPRVKIRVDYTNKDYGHAEMTVDDIDAPRMIRDLARMMVVKCPDASPFQPSTEV